MISYLIDIYTFRFIKPKKELIIKEYNNTPFLITEITIFYGNRALIGN